MKTYQFICLSLTFILTACAGQGKSFTYLADTRAQVWPAPPETARFAYVGELSGELNFTEQSRQFSLRKLVGWIVGGLIGKKTPEQLQRPQAGAVDSAGRVFVTDVHAQAVFVFDTVQGKFKKWQAASRTQFFLSPVGIALSKERLYVADSELAWVSILDAANGEPLAKLDFAFARPTGLAIDEARSEIYVADTKRHQIFVFDATGKLMRTLGEFGNQSAQLNGPTHIAYAHEQIYIADTLNARIQVFSRQGQWRRSIGQRGTQLGQMSRPKGIMVTRSGNICVIESFYDHLLVFNQQGQLLLPLGGEGSGVGQFYLPAGIWQDESNRVYIADMFNSRVVVLKFLEGV